MPFLGCTWTKSLHPSWLHLSLFKLNKLFHSSRVGWTNEFFGVVYWSKVEGYLQEHRWLEGSCLIEHLSQHQCHSWKLHPWRSPQTAFCLCSLREGTCASCHFLNFSEHPKLHEFLEQVLGAPPSPGRNVLVQKKQSHSILNSLPCHFNKCQNISNSERFHDLVITVLNSGLLGLSLRTPNMQFDVFLSITDW